MTEVVPLDGNIGARAAALAERVRDKFSAALSAAAASVLTLVVDAAANDPKEAAYLPKAGHNDLPVHGSIQLVIEFLERQFST